MVVVGFEVLLLLVMRLLEVPISRRHAVIV
jgi:hypothetical protein